MQSRPHSQKPHDHDYFQLRSGLENSRVRFERDLAGRVAFLGGSITETTGWRDLVCEDLQSRFPRTRFDFVNAGIASLGSTPGAFRFGSDVLVRGPVDLLFAEAAVNDSTNGQTPVEQVRGLEGIVRQARLANPAVDIVLLHFVDPDKMAVIKAGRTPEVIQNHEKVADRYALPSIDLAREVTERILAGEFTWEKDFIDLHPAPFGHRLYAQSIGRLFDAAWTGQLSDNSTLHAYPLPEPLDAKSYFRGRFEALQKASLADGWSLVPRWTPSDGAGTRPGFVDVPALVSATPGAGLTLDFEGTGVGIFVASGPDCGAVEYRVDGGPWSRRELFTRWSPSLHLPWAQVLSGDLEPGPHRLELKVSSASDPQSRGHAVRIVHFLIAGLETSSPS